MLAVPLYQAQIDASVRLRKGLPQWQLSDAALFALHQGLSGFTSEICLLKSVAVNSIYGTNVLAIVQVAKQVKEVLGHYGASQAGPELVVAIANAAGEESGPTRRRTSFGSKFCHFFVDAERFPIYDDAARQALNLHLGTPIKAHDYEAFCAGIAQLKRIVGHNCSTRTLDHYLWLTGMYLRWLKQRKKIRPKVNAELLTLFNAPTKAQSADLDILLPAILDRVFKGEL